MTAKQVLTLLQLLSLLENGPMSPSAVAQAAQTSLATANRKLKDALAAGLAVKVGRGPATQYRVSTNEEHLSAVRDSRASGTGTAAAKGSRVFMEMDAPTAGLIQTALEMYARLGMGQFDKLLDLPRFGSMLRTDGTEVPTEVLDTARMRLDELKTLLTGLASNAYYGISSAKIGSEFRKAWEAHRALRHRLAWDRTPTGGGGVQYDEAFMEGPDRPDLTVSSGEQVPTSLDLLEQLPKGTFIGKKGKTYRVVGPNKDNTAMALYADSESPQTAVLMAQNVVKGDPARKFTF